MLIVIFRLKEIKYIYIQYYNVLDLFRKKM